MDWQLFASTFVLIFLAELPGKTTFASLFLATRVNPIPVFIGACGAFVVHSAIAVAAGSLLGFLPVRIAQVGAGLLFLILAIRLWREKPAPSDGPRIEIGFVKIMATAFTVVFVAQWGDLTQLATAALAAKYTAPWTIFLSATLALWTVVGLAVAIGHHAKKSIHPIALQKAMSIVLAGVGLVLLGLALR